MINAIGSVGSQTSTVQPAKPATPAVSSSNMPAKTMVDTVHSQVTYNASLNSLRQANKMMMGYLLNIEV